MKINTLLLLASVVFSFVASAGALADWKGDMHMTTPGHGPNAQPMAMDGKVFGQEGAMRLDVDSPHGKMSIISDWKKRKAWSLMHSQKIAMETSMDRVGVDVPHCTGSSFAACLEKNGYKKTGSETVNGHPCAIFEKDHATPRGTTHVKLWQPTDLKGVPLVRSVSQSAQGHGGQVDFTNIELVASLDSSLFSPPSDYHQQAGFTPSRGAGPGGLPPGSIPANGHMTPEQVQKLREQMMKQYGQPGGQ